MEPREIIAGIDLGTTNSAIAILQNGSPRLIEIDGRPTLPSCVGLSESGDILTGHPALNQLAAAPLRTVTSIKRRMGSDLPVMLGDREFRPEEISAFILKRLRQEAERQLGRPVEKAVITVPAYFDEKQRRATQDAARLAGLEPVRILNEPTAAALAYNVQNQDGQTILIYDLGGGTFDVSLVVCEKGVVEVKASHGDTQLGGDDFDRLLTAHLLAGWKERDGADLNDPRLQRRLTIAAEAAKCRLSDHPFAQVREEYLTPGSHLVAELFREELERLIAPLLEKTWDCIHAALRDGKVPTQDVDKILLVGGSTRIPLVRRSIEERIGLPPSAEINPDLIVAMGAALQAGIIAGEESGSILVDITAHTFSTGAVWDRGFANRCVPIIPRGTPLPVTRSEAFETIVRGQKTVRVEVYQGESGEPDENLELGNFLVDGLDPSAPAGSIILCQFGLDLNGVLEVTAIEKSTGLAKSVTIDTRDVVTALDLAAARAKMEEVAGGGASAPAPTASTDPHDEVRRARDLKRRAAKLLAGDLDATDVKDVEQLLESSLRAIKTGQLQELKQCSDKLEDILFYLEA